MAFSLSSAGKVMLRLVPPNDDQLPGIFYDVFADDKEKVEATTESRDKTGQYINVRMFQI